MNPRNIGLWLLVVGFFQLTTADQEVHYEAKIKEEVRYAENLQALEEQLAALASTTVPATSTTTTVATTLPPLTSTASTLPPVTATTVPATSTTSTTTTTTTTVPAYAHGDIPPNTPFGLFTSAEMGLENTPLLEGDLADADKHALDGGVAHRPTTGFPGSGGNVVITGHRRSVGKDVFHHIDKLEPGDLIQIQTVWNGRTDMFVYEVEHTQAEIETSTPELEVRFVETYFVKQAEYETLTLVSCDPPGSTTHRYLVRARLVSVNGESR